MRKVTHEKKVSNIQTQGRIKRTRKKEKGYRRELRNSYKLYKQNLRTRQTR